MLGVSGSSKCFTKAVPTGKLQSPPSEKPMRWTPGSAIQRCFTARSDQSGEFTSYSTSPGAGVSEATSSKSPVRESEVGNEGPDPPLAVPGRYRLPVIDTR